MASFRDHHIAFAEPVDHGLLIVFIDGASAIYPDTFLRERLAEMKESSSQITLPEHFSARKMPTES